MNKVVLIGRLTKDSELKFTPGNGTAVTTITLAVDKYNAQTKKNEADFINVVIWGKQAESVATYMSKGSQIAIYGRLQTRSYDDKEGNKRYITEVVAQEVSFLSKNANAQKNETYDYIQKAREAMMFDEDMSPVNDTQIPF